MERARTAFSVVVVMIALAGTTAGTYFVTTGTWRDQIRRSAEARVNRAQNVHRRVSRLYAVELASLVSERARASEVLAVFDKGDPALRQETASGVCANQAWQLKKENRRADIVAILEDSGKTLGMDSHSTPDVGDAFRTSPAVLQALKGTAVKDVWIWQDRLYDVAVAPVRRGSGVVLGALLFGWAVSAVTSQSSADLLGTEIGFFHNGKIFASSFKSGEDPTKEDVDKTQALGRFIFSGENLAMQVLKDGRPSTIISWANEGDEFVLAVSPAPGNFADKTSGSVVLASLSEGTVGAHKMAEAVLVLGFLSMLIAAVGVVYAGTSPSSPSRIGPRLLAPVITKGMSIEKVESLLGQPSSGGSLAEALNNARGVVGAPTLEGQNGMASYIWNHPAGTYQLTVVDGIVTEVREHP